MAKIAPWLEEENLIRLEGWAKDGLSEEEMAHNMGINRTTLYRWKKRYSAIEQALKQGKEVADYVVENALFKRAVGYHYQETTREMKDGVERVTKVVEKHMAPVPLH